jgi:WD40 repeat protein
VANPAVVRGHEGPAFAVAISPDYRWVVTGGDDNTTRLWDLSAKNPALNSWLCVVTNLRYPRKPIGHRWPESRESAPEKRDHRGARISQINMLDHVIVGQAFDGRPGYFSFKEAGVI